ncbi:DNA repair exonuclease [Actinocrinis puniceicyclus]|uniref:DNA repair exonuclease n=1 Tax=Actinocrinis puniceicyclus TaxID=977794 RepID=A0A8J7WPD5_9ACTN|nr:DNA repair exonuclease [Actinocrinis puniceicyclus]
MGGLIAVKLLHAADLHIDSPLRGLERYPDAPVAAIRTATRRAMENLVQLALAEAVDAVLLAGDIYDGDWRGYDTGLFFQRQLGLLAEAQIPVYLVSGNHDAESQISRNLTLPRNVHQFTTHQAEYAVDEKAGIAVHGQGYASRAVTDNLAAQYPRALPGLFNIGLLHTALDGRREGHAPYAPCSVEQLAALGYGYWALGHIHKREVVSDQPHIVFSGNIQGRHAREAGPKGCTLVTVESGTVSVEERHLDVVRWAHLQVDASSANDLDDACELVRRQLTEERDRADGRLLAARVSVVGRSAAHTEVWRDHERLTHEVRTIAFDLSDVWVEKVRPSTRPPIEDAAAGVEDGAELIDGLMRTARELGADADALRALIEKDPLWSKLPREAREENHIGSGDPQWRERLLEEASDLLVSMLQERVR